MGPLYCHFSSSSAELASDTINDMWASALAMFGGNKSLLRFGPPDHKPLKAPKPTVTSMLGTE